MSENKPSLYGLTTEYQSLYNQLIESVDEETGEVDITISNALTAKGKEFEEKAVAVASVYRKFDNEIALYEQEIKRLQEYKERLKKCKERLKDNLSYACQTLGYEKIDGVYAHISFRTSEETIIDDEDMLEEEFIRVKVEPNKTAIKNAIKAGIEVRGAHIEKKKNINIK